MREVVHYLDIPRFVQKGAGIVRFGTAPDGLPLLVNVPEPPRAEGLLREAALAMGVEAAEPDYDGTPLEALVTQLDRLLRAQLVQHLTGSEAGTQEVMILPRPIRALVGATLLERLFTTWEMPRPLSGGLQPDTRAAPPAAPQAAAPSPAPQPKFQVGEAYLAVPVAGERSVVVRKERGAHGWPAYAFVRPFTEETTSLFGDSWYEATGYGTARIAPNDGDRYRRLRADSPMANWQWVVPRGAVARIVMDLAERLAGLQETDEIHGDLKPANVLVTAAAPLPLDSLALAPGARSPAMTRGWAAPEQVLGLAVSPQTDQYPLGLLLLGLVGGVLYGEEARVSIPVGGTRLEYHTVLRNPAVYIDPDTAPVNREHVDAWRDVIERCVRFEAADRFPALADLIAALRPLTTEPTLHDTLNVPLTFGRLILGHDGAGEPEPCWLT